MATKIIKYKEKECELETKDALLFEILQDLNYQLRKLIAKL